MDFIYLFRVLLKRKWLIIGSALLAAAIAFFFTRNEQKQFKSFSQFSTGFTTGNQEILLSNREPINLQEAGTQFNNVIATMASPAVTSLLSYRMILHDLENPSKAFLQLTPEQKSTKAFQQVNLEQAKKFFNEKLNSMTMLNTYNPEERKLVEFLKIYGYDLKSINERLVVYRVQSTDFIQADYVSHNPELSAFAVNTVFSEYLRYNRGFRGTRDQQAIDTLQNIVTKKREDLEKKNAQLRSIGINVSDDGSSSALSVVSALEIDKANETARLTEMQFELGDVTRRIQSLTGSSNTGTSSPNEQIIMARKAKNEAYQAYLANPSDKALEARYTQLNAEYERLLKLYNDTREVTTPSAGGDGLASLRVLKGTLESKIQASRQKIGQLNGEINRQRGTYLNDAQKSAEAMTLIKETEQANKEYLEAKAKYDEATTFTGTGGVNKFNLVVPGQPALDPEPSKRLLIVGMAGAAAMITVMLVLIFLAYLDSSIKTPAIFSRTVGLRMISMVNFTNLKGKNLADIVANRDRTEDAAEKRRNNIFRESLRKLRYEIEHSGKKVFLFTSTKKGQGKTTIIQALSYSMSLSKKKILIIDTNFCNNDLTIQLNADPILEKIVPYKSDGSALLEQVKVFSKDIGVGTVYAIGSEGGDYTPSEVLPRENLLHHLQHLTTEFDYIFLEGPPLNDFSDSLELSQYVEGVIAVFSANHIMKQTDKQSIQFFKELNGKFVGAILNMVDLKNVDVA
jgi:Mrp family chromosome partitioning ATPase/uncharacterized protein involved in exopolysaccharide biosynthesis